MSGAESESDAGPRRPAIPTSVGSADTDTVYDILLDRRLGSGHFGDIYMGIHRTSGKKYAVKVEHRTSRSVAKREWEVLKCLNGNGCPKIYYTCIYSDYYIMVIDLLGITLQKQLENHPLHKLPWDSAVRNIAVQAVKLLRILHGKGYVHGDVKPENFLLDINSQHNNINQLYMIDFGLASRWRDLTRESGHVAYKQKVDHFTGTIRYASINAHFGRQLSRRDDIESLAYMLLFLVQGSLPWQGFTMPSHDKNMYVCEAKGKYSVDALCSGQPKVLKYLLAYAKEMKYEEKPDYDYLLMLCAHDGEERLHRLLDGTDNDNTPQKKQGIKRPLSADEKDNADGNSNINTNTKRRVRPRNANSVVEPACTKFCQWIIASNTPTDEYSPGKQTFSSHTSYANLQAELERKWASGMRVVLLDMSGNMWTAVLNENSGYRTQTVKITREFVPREWHEKGEFITSLAGNSTNWGVITSSGTNYAEQIYHVASVFPAKWVAKQWKRQFFVTDVAVQGDKYDGKWAVVMSKFKPDAGNHNNNNSYTYTDQAVEIDFKYPSQAIHARWNEEFIITNIAASNSTCVFVFSKKRKRRNGTNSQIFEEKQRCVRTSHNALDKIREEWNDGLYVKCLAYGRVK